MCDDLQDERSEWLLKVTTCRGRGHIVAAALQVAQLVVIIIITFCKKVIISYHIISYHIYLIDITVRKHINTSKTVQISVQTRIPRQNNLH